MKQYILHGSNLHIFNFNVAHHWLKFNMIHIKSEICLIDRYVDCYLYRCTAARDLDTATDGTNDVLELLALSRKIILFTYTFTLCISMLYAMNSTEMKTSCKVKLNNSYIYMYDIITHSMFNENYKTKQRFRENLSQNDWDGHAYISRQFYGDAAPIT